MSWKGTTERQRKRWEREEKEVKVMRATSDQNEMRCDDGQCSQYFTVEVGMLLLMHDGIPDHERGESVVSQW